MPKSVDIQEKYINDIRVDKENDSVFFNDDSHTYYDKDTMEKYVSVTTLIHQYSQEFDSAFWSSYKALEVLMDEETFKVLKKTLLATKKFNPKVLKKFNIDEEEFLAKQNEILAEYDRKREESCTRGTAIHLEKELSFYGKSKFNFSKYGYADLDGEYTCKKDSPKLDAENGIFPEYLISLKSRDGLLRVCGTADLVVKRGNDIWILDWKTNAKIDKQSYYNRSTKSYTMMKYPLNNIQDCNFMIYSLQLSLYAYLLQQINPEFNIKGLKLVHIDHDNIQHEYECEYLRDNVEAMLKHYKKQLKVKKELDALKPVIV